jgi:Tol biopolymer transport system component
MRRFVLTWALVLWLAMLVLVAGSITIGRLLPGGVLAFESNREGNSEIFLLDINRPRFLYNLTAHPAQDANPAWSPDGRKLAFETYAPQRERMARGRSISTGNGKTVYIMDTMSRRRDVWQAVPQGIQAIEPSWSPDGNMLAVAGWAGNMSTNDIYVVYVYDHDFQQITKTPNKSEYNPSWSPNGANLLFGSRDRATQTPDDVYALRFIPSGLGLIAYPQRDNMLPTYPVRLSDFPGAGYPTWLSDDRVMFTYNPVEQRLYTTAPEADAPDEALNDVQLLMEEPQMSPDGRWIAFASAPSRGIFWRGIYIMRPDGSELRRLTFGNEQFAYRDLSPVWRPRR